ncbi:E3 ubiquitin-protein ligase ZNF645 [Gracilaria domingensis]|nr:E3 ubiquitin-protein ligase ZNF645 [Gracilaria domingensis]
MRTTVTAPCEGFRPSGLLINARRRNNQKDFTAKGVRQRKIRSKIEAGVEAEEEVAAEQGAGAEAEAGD